MWGDRRTRLEDVNSCHVVVMRDAVVASLLTRHRAEPACCCTACVHERQVNIHMHLEAIQSSSDGWPVLPYFIRFKASTLDEF